MDLQSVINMGAGVALTVVGWFARQLWGAVKELQTDLAKLREELPKTYTTKDDFREATKDIGQKLDHIIAQLGNKADR